MKLKLLTLLALFFQAAILTGFSHAAEQVITPSQRTFNSIAANQDIEFKVIYTTDDVNSSGVRVKLFFDSSQLIFTQTSAVFQESLIAIDGTAKADTNNEDGDEKTDQSINAAWADFSPPAGWPGQTPVDLYTVKFKTAANFTGSTPINLNGKPGNNSTVQSKNVTVTANAAAVAAGEGGADDPTPTPKKKKGGSMSWLFLTPLIILGLLRRRLR